ncbi:MAG: DctP family TRAP transporter solute-binding subunit [Paenibacillaceae bacterium]
MRQFLGIVLFIIVGLITAISIGFSSLIPSLPYPYDDEQDGLGEEIVIRFSFVVAENTPKGLAAQRFAQLVKEKTGGRVKVELFPNSILYNDHDEVKALKNGDVQIIAPSFSVISEEVSDWMVMDIPFAFANLEAVEEAFNGEIGAILFKKLEDKNMVGMAYWSNGFKQMTSNKGPLLRPADFKGLRFRILPSRVIAAQFAILGAQTESILFNQVYRSMESGIVDGGENTISNIYSKKFYQVQKYMTLSNHGYLGYGVLMNKTFWDGLPYDLKALVQEAMDEASVWANQIAIEINQKQLEELRASHLIQIDELTFEQKKDWMSTLNGVFSEIESIIDPDLIQSIKELQHKYASLPPEN